MACHFQTLEPHHGVCINSQGCGQLLVHTDKHLTTGRMCGHYVAVVSHSPSDTTFSFRTRGRLASRQLFCVGVTATATGHKLPRVHLLKGAELSLRTERMDWCME